MSEPLVSCLMVTANRADLARRAVACFAAQTWDNKELVIIDDGDEDYEPILAPYRDEHTIHYHRIEKKDGVYLGELRNVSLDHANGDFCMQWDDDEWYHPERIATQMAEIERRGLDAIVLRWTLMHLDKPEFVEKPYRTFLKEGTPGTIVHRRTDVRYPNQPKAEDSVFRERLSKVMKLGQLVDGSSHLFIRCFHGDNTWDQEHFTERLRYTLSDKLHYLKARFIDRDIFAHPAFDLSDKEREAVDVFLRQSRELGLIQS